MIGRAKYRQLVQHQLFGSSFSGADVSVIMGLDGQATQTSSTVNPGFPRAVRARRVWLNAGTAGINVAGDWTLKLRLNRTGTDSATFTFNPVDLDDVFSGGWSSEVLIQATDQYHLLAEGPSRVFMLLRATLEFEII